MAPSKDKTPASAGPTLHVVTWLKQHAELPVEAAAGFLRAMAAETWHTAEEWQARWDHWWHTPPKTGRR